MHAILGLHDDLFSLVWPNEMLCFLCNDKFALVTQMWFLGVDGDMGHYTHNEQGIA